MEYHKGFVYHPEKCPRPDKEPLTKDVAKKTAAALRHKNGWPVEAYLCEPTKTKGCGAWHTGKGERGLNRVLKEITKGTS